jgi:hypothetical protein
MKHALEPRVIHYLVFKSKKGYRREQVELFYILSELDSRSVQNGTGDYGIYTDNPTKTEAHSAIFRLRRRFGRLEDRANRLKLYPDFSPL